jgi:hypothetical protein
LVINTDKVKITIRLINDAIDSIFKQFIYSLKNTTFHFVEVNAYLSFDITIKLSKTMDRRKFAKIIPVLGTSAALSAFEKETDIMDRIASIPASKGKSVMGLKVKPMAQVRIGIIGLGNRGSSLLRHLASFYPEKARIVAICDIKESKTSRAFEFLNRKSQPAEVYAGNSESWKKMVEKESIDLVMIFTPWKEHVRMCTYSMQCGCHVAVEVPAAYTVEGCWDLVNTAEEYQRNCMMLENVCYGAEELWVLNMVHQGIFGELTYAEAAYIHNLRSMLFDNSYYNKWRIRHHLHRHGNLYPTHGLGPVAQYLGIDRGDRFEKLISMSSKEASLSAFAKTVHSENEFYKHDQFNHGDINNSLINTHHHRTILLKHDVVTPRPYSRINALGGTEAYHEGYPSRLSINGKGHQWLSTEAYNSYWNKYQHPIWDELKDPIEKHGGHGGMDFVMLYRLIDNLNQGLPLDMDVYDAASWSVVSALSEISVELGNVPVKFPDFTRGRWKEKRMLGILSKIHS